MSEQALPQTHIGFNDPEIRQAALKMEAADDEAKDKEITLMSAFKQELKQQMIQPRENPPSSPAAWQRLMQGVRLALS